MAQATQNSTAAVREMLPKVLPKDPKDAISGPELVKKLRAMFEIPFTDGSLIVRISQLASDPTSPIARKPDAYGYYLRAPATVFESEIPEKVNSKSPASGKVAKASKEPSSKSEQLEEKFRLLLCRYLESNGHYPVYIDHTKGVRGRFGQNKWKFPDIIDLEWDKGLLDDDEVIDGDDSEAPGVRRLDPDLLAVRRGLGDQPFKITSLELKVAVTLGSLREIFFQTVSNSKWAHKAQLAIAIDITDELITEELRRLGTSFGVAITTYGLSQEKLAALPDAKTIDTLPEDKLEKHLSAIRRTDISGGGERVGLDWEHFADLRYQSEEFEKVIRWISICLDRKRALTFRQYKEYKRLAG